MWVSWYKLNYRAKYHRLTHDGEEPPNHLFSPGLEDSDNEETGPNRKASVVPLDVDAIIEQEKRDAQWESARQTLRQCLQVYNCFYMDISKYFLGSWLRQWSTWCAFFSGKASPWSQSRRMRYVKIHGK